MWSYWGNKNHDCRRILSLFTFASWATYDGNWDGSGAWSYLGWRTDMARHNFLDQYTPERRRAMVHELAHHDYWMRFGPDQTQQDQQANEAYALEMGWNCTSF
jgi:hypothetical protein